MTNTDRTSLDEGHRCPHGPQYAPRGYAIERSADDGTKVMLRVQNTPCACDLIVSHMMHHVALRFRELRANAIREAGGRLDEAAERALRERMPELVAAEYVRWTVSAL